MSKAPVTRGKGADCFLITTARSKIGVSSVRDSRPALNNVAFGSRGNRLAYLERLRLLTLMQHFLGRSLTLQDLPMKKAYE